MRVKEPWTKVWFHKCVHAVCVIVHYSRNVLYQISSFPTQDALKSKARFWIQAHFSQTAYTANWETAEDLFLQTEQQLGAPPTILMKNNTSSEVLCVFYFISVSITTLLLSRPLVS